MKLRVVEVKTTLGADKLAIVDASIKRGVLLPPNAVVENGVVEAFEEPDTGAIFIKVANGRMALAQEALFGTETIEELIRLDLRQKEEA